MKRVTASVLLSLFLAACGGAPVTKAPPPFRPTPVAKEPPPPPPKVKTDCDPSGPADALPFLMLGEDERYQAEVLRLAPSPKADPRRAIAEG